MAKIIKKHSKSAFVLALTLVLVATYVLVPQGKAATLANREVKLSDSRPSTATTYDFEADHSNTGIACINIQFCTTASGTCTGAGTTFSTPTGAAKADSSLWSGLDYANWGVATAADIIGLSLSSGTATTPNPTTNVSYAFGTITNPADTGTYYARITTTTASSNCATSSPGGSTVDSGVVAFAIIYGVTVSATVPEYLSSAVYAVASATCTVSGGTSQVTSTASTVPFGTITLNDFYDSCQDVRVATNALNYTTRVYEGGSLTCTNSGLCGSNTISDGVCDSACSYTATGTWATDTNNGFGYCMDDQATYGDGAQTAGWDANSQCGAGGQAFKIFGITSASATAIMSSSGAAVSDDRAFIGYRLSVSASQTAGPYSNTVVFVTTPTY